MSPVPASAITIADGEITIDAELLAPKLGLSAEALKAEMRKGNVSSVAETGIDEDAGRTRVTFRYRTRAWTVVVDPDGTLRDRLSFMLVESIAPAAKAPPANTNSSLIRSPHSSTEPSIYLTFEPSNCVSTPSASGVLVDAGLGDAGDDALAHLGLQRFGRQTELGRGQLGIDGDLAVRDGDR